MEQALAKGSILVHLRDFILERHGQQAWEDVLARVTPEDAKTLRGILMVGVWYPIGTWNRTLDRYLPKYFPDPMAAMGVLATYIAQRDLTTFYKMFLKVGTPGFILGRASSLWSRYFSTTCAVHSTEVGLREWRLQLSGPLNEDEAPSVYTCEGVCSWLTAGVRLTGANLVIQHSRCRFRQGNEHCEYEARW